MTGEGRRLPVVVVFNGKKYLIRGVHPRILSWMVLRLRDKGGRFEKMILQENQPGIDVALAIEALRRDNPPLSSGVRGAAAAMAGYGCKCGGEGLYVVGHETYCRRCLRTAQRHLAATRSRGIEQRAAAVKEARRQRNRDYKERRSRRDQADRRDVEP